MRFLKFHNFTFFKLSEASSINPTYSYWAYYVRAILMVLNRFRESKGYTTLTFRPHSGEVRKDVIILFEGFSL